MVSCIKIHQDWKLLNCLEHKITVSDSDMSFQFNFTLETADESGGSLARSGTLLLDVNVQTSVNWRLVPCLLWQAIAILTDTIPTDGLRTDNISTESGGDEKREGKRKGWEWKGEGTVGLCPLTKISLSLRAPMIMSQPARHQHLLLPCRPHYAGSPAETQVDRMLSTHAKTVVWHGHCRRRDHPSPGDDWQHSSVLPYDMMPQHNFSWTWVLMGYLLLHEPELKK